MFIPSQHNSPSSSPWRATGGGYDYYWNFCVDLVSVPPELDLTGPVPVLQLSSNRYPSVVGRLDGYQISELGMPKSSPTVEMCALNFSFS